jgi:protein subunit release factor B
MALFGSSIEKAKDLRKKMLQLKIFEKDIQESFIRSSGPGGQNVNKVSTCVVLHHRPTGVQVKSQQERTQGLNRYKARCQLIDKIEAKYKDLKRQIEHDRAKKKRQNRKRSRASKESMLEAKRQQSQQKLSRRKINARAIEEY